MKLNIINFIAKNKEGEKIINRGQNQIEEDQSVAPLVVSLFK